MDYQIGYILYTISMLTFIIFHAVVCLVMIKSDEKTIKKMKHAQKSSVIVPSSYGDTLKVVGDDGTEYEYTLSEW